MAFEDVKKIWMNGKLVDFADAKVHVFTHALHYGSGVFEGIRCYATSRGPEVFRLDEHLDRLFWSAKMYRMEIPWTKDQLRDATLETIRANAFDACYIRPLAYRGFGMLGVNPFPNPVDVMIGCYPWGKYLGPEAMEKGVDVCCSSWTRLGANTMPAMAKSTANYANSQLIKMDRPENLLGGTDASLLLRNRPDLFPTENDVYRASLVPPPEAVGGVCDEYPTWSASLTDDPAIAAQRIYNKAGMRVVIDTAANIGIRETRRIVGEYRLSEDDIMAGRVFEDRVARVYGRNAPGVDVHNPDGKEGSAQDSHARSIVHGERGLFVPYRSLVPQRIEGLLVAGRSISQTHDAEKWTRIEAACIKIGQAAGTAAAVAAAEDVAVREVDVSRVQQRLIAQGVPLDQPLEAPLPEPAAG